MTKPKRKFGPRPSIKGYRQVNAKTPLEAAARERRATIARLILAGRTTSEITAELGITVTKFRTDSAVLRKQGVIRAGDLKSERKIPDSTRRRGPDHWRSNPDYQAKKVALLARVEAGEDYLEVAHELKVAHSTAYAWVKNAGLFDETKARRTPIEGDPEWEAKHRELLSLIANGMPTTHAADQLELSRTTAQRWVKLAGLVGKKKEPANPAPIPYDKLGSNAKKACEKFGFFSNYYLGLEWPPWAELTAEKLLKLYHSPEDEYAVVNVGPGFGKSTLITFAFTSWVATRERAMGEEPTISLGHASWQKATWYSKRLRTLWTFNDKLIKDYGRFKPESGLAPWSVEELLIEPVKWGALREKEPTVVAQSYEGSILSGRYGLIEWDDLIDKRNSATVEAREKLADWWERDAEGRMNQGGLLILSNARFGPEDLSWQVRQAVDYEYVGDPNAEGPPRPLYTQIAFPSHDERNCTAPALGKHTGPWPEGCLLDPQRGSWKRLAHFIVKNEGRFRLVWQQEDTDPMGFLAERVWFEGGPDRTGTIHKGCFNYGRRMGEMPDRTDQPLLSLMSIDPSSSHYWAIQNWLIYPDDTQVLLQGQRSMLKVHELLYEPEPGRYTGVLEDYWQHSISKGVGYTYLIYEMNIQKALPEMPYFNDWAQARNVIHIPHTTTVNKTDPDSGVEMLGQLYRGALVDLPYEGVDARIFSDQFRREACAWPEGRTDDLIMAHWFPNHRLRQLVAAVQAYDSDYDPDAIPSWARRSTPSWAQSRLGGARVRDSRDTIPA